MWICVDRIVEVPKLKIFYQVPEHLRQCPFHHRLAEPHPALVRQLVNHAFQSWLVQHEFVGKSDVLE